MSCITYINLNPNNIPVTITGTTCLGVYTATTLNYGQAICMDNSQQIYTCGNADIGASCFNPTPPVTPTQTKTPTLTPTTTPTQSCSPFTQQYMEVQIQSCHNFKLILWNNSNFTSAANAVCDVVVSGCAYGDQGTIFCGQETILSGQHQHNFSLQPVLQPGECVSAFTVNTITPQCNCYNVTYVPQTSPTPTRTPTPTITPTLTPTLTPTITPTITPTLSPTNTITPTRTPTPTITPTLSPTSGGTTPTQTQTPTITPTLTPTITPTITPTTTPTPTSGVTGCLCYRLLNETGNPIEYQWDDCVLGASNGTLNGGQSVQVCAVDLPVIDPGGTITPCTTVTNCSEGSDCTGCS